MAENLRESFRVEPSTSLVAELFHEGRVTPCSVLNLSAGGARVKSTVQMDAGTQCTLGVRLENGKLGAAAKQAPYVSFLMEVLEAMPAQDRTQRIDYRLRNMTAPGSADYEAGVRLVFEAQRQLLAREAGNLDASPMTSTTQRRRSLRQVLRSRFSSGSTRPGRRG